MASMSVYSPLCNPAYNDVVSFPTTRSSTLTFKTSFFGFKLPGKPFSFSNRYTLRSKTVLASSNSTHSFDVVIIGAGIIGLTIAHQFLTTSNLSVALVDKSLPCSGATGAGQGYIWMGHKSPECDTWDLTLRSHILWSMLAESIRDRGFDPLQVLGWKKTGSLLVSRRPEESEVLKKRVKQLSEAGLKADYLSSRDLRSEEPAVDVGEGGGAAFFPDDCQLDAHRTVAFIEKANRSFASKGRYAEFYHDPVTDLLRSSTSGEIEAVQTSKNTLYSNKAIVVAAGCWSGSLMRDLFKESTLDVPVKPRKGHLLVVENFSPFKLNHGLMEVGYVDHQQPEVANPVAGLVDHGKILSVSMTATMDALGNLVLGSSREFSGFNTEVDESIVGYIWNRAGEFFPKLKELSLEDITLSRKLRIGLRPYMPDGKPVIGSVPDFSNVIIATGHEGGGLSMAMGTAEMVADMVLGNPGAVNYAPFSVQGRCC
ncbi:FAD-dependent oxidoreductase family protein [Euphorbia peplus]|nr:FAD-dependent oxidoreductase family protein [Euphorbia peplus]